MWNVCHFPAESGFKHNENKPHVDVDRDCMVCVRNEPVHEKKVLITYAQACLLICTASPDPLLFVHTILVKELEEASDSHIEWLRIWRILNRKALSYLFLWDDSNGDQHCTLLSRRCWAKQPSSKINGTLETTWISALGALFWAYWGWTDYLDIQCKFPRTGHGKNLIPKAYGRTNWGETKFSISRTAELDETRSQTQNQDCLLMIRLNDNHSPRPVKITPWS